MTLAFEDHLQEAIRFARHAFGKTSGRNKRQPARHAITGYPRVAGVGGEIRRGELGGVKSQQQIRAADVGCCLALASVQPIYDLGMSETAKQVFGVEVTVT